MNNMVYCFINLNFVIIFRNVVGNELNNWEFGNFEYLNFFNSVMMGVMVVYI